MITAGGTVEATADLSRAAMAWRWIEMALMFGAAPLLMTWIVHGEKIPVFAALLPVLAIAALLLLADPTFRLRDELKRGVSIRTALSILALFVVIGGVATWWIRHNHPAWFLEFPINRPDTYRQIMLLYPLFSVAAQELLYRTFYFHRYGPLFGAHAWLAVIVNGLLFGFAHIVIGNAFAIAATALGGLVLAARYAASKSFWAVFVEHTLWGWLFFTIGLGRYFFTGVSNL
jgi:membrane protease YdiL (CAAX protease family)